MAESGTLHDAFLDELRDAYDGEKQLTKALPKMAKAATSPILRDAFEAHLKETRVHIERLEQVMEGLGEKVRGKHCDGLAGIIEEGKAVMGEDFDEATMDACLIASGQRAEHYEIAAYGTLVAWAEAMGHTDAVALLQETLDEEKTADEKLTSIAEELTSLFDRVLKFCAIDGLAVELDTAGSIEQLSGERDRNINVTILRFAEERSALFFDSDDAQRSTANLDLFTDRRFVREELVLHVPADNAHVSYTGGFAIRHEPAFTDRLVLDVGHVGSDAHDPGGGHFETVVIQIRTRIDLRSDPVTKSAVVANVFVLFPLDVFVATIAALVVFVGHLSHRSHTVHHEVI